MKTKHLIWILTLLLLVSTATATTNESFVTFWNMPYSEGQVYCSVDSSNDGAETGGSMTEGIGDGAWRMNGVTGDELEWSTGGGGTIDDDIYQNGFCAGIYLNMTDPWGANQAILGLRGDATKTYLGLQTDNGNSNKLGYEFRTEGGGYIWNEYTVTWNNHEYHQIVINYNITNGTVELYFDGIGQGAETSNSGGWKPSNAAFPNAVGQIGGSQNIKLSEIAQVGIRNVTCTPTFIEDWYNSGDVQNWTELSGIGGAPPPETPAITLDYNASTYEHRYTTFIATYEYLEAQSDSVSYFVYGGQSYTANKNYVNASHIEFNYSLYTPYVPANETVIPFYWNTSINNTGTYNKSSNGSQTIIQHPRNITIQWEPSVSENETTNLNITFLNYVLNNTATATLIYGGTEHAGVIDYTNHSVVTFTYELTAPLQRYNNTAYPFFWNYTFISPNDWINNTNHVTSNKTQYIEWPTNRSYATITARNNITGAAITNFYVNVTGDDYGASYTYNVTTGTVNIPQIHNVTRVITVWGATYAPENYNLTFIENESTSLQADLIEVGAIWIRVYTEDDATPINGADIRIVNLDGDLDTTTDTGADNAYYALINETGNISIYVWQNTSYTQKIYYELMEPGRYVSIKAYLISAADTQETTFTVINEYSQLVADAQLSFYTTVDGDFVKVGQVKTDFSGVAIANLDSTTTYMLRVTANGYLQKEVTFIPTSTSYTVTLQSSGLDYVSLYDNIDYHIEPTGNKGLDTNTTYNFLMSISSADNNLQYWGVKITYANGTTYIDNKTDSTGGIALIPLLTPLNSTRLTATYFFLIFGEEYWEKNIEYYVYRTPNGSYTFTQALTDHTDDFTGFEKALIASIIVLVIVGGTAIYTGFNTLLLGIEILLIYGCFAYMEWIPSWIYALIAVPTIIIALITNGGEQ